MGHGHSSAQLGGAGGLCAAGGGAARPVAERGELTPSAAWHAAARPGRSTWLLLATIRAYQLFLSPVLSSGCRFYPSCSRYAYQAIERHGARRGCWLALRRLLRCQPFSPGGFDPVPESEQSEPETILVIPFTASVYGEPSEVRRAETGARNPSVRPLAPVASGLSIHERDAGAAGDKL